MNKKMIFLVFSTALAFAACTPATKPSPITDTPTDTTQETMVAPDKDTTMMAETSETENPNLMAEADYTVEMANFRFSEPEMEAEPGQTLTVKLVGKDMLHDLVIDELDVKSNQLKAGEEETIEITVPATAKPGDTYEYYCSVGNHKAQGMVGTLTVK